MKNECIARFTLHCCARFAANFLLVAFLISAASPQIFAQCLDVKKDSVNCMDVKASLTVLPEELWPDTVMVCIDSIKKVSSLGVNFVVNPDKCVDAIAETIFRSYRVEFSDGTFEDLTDTTCVFSIDISSESLLCPVGIDTVQCGDPEPNAYNDPSTRVPRFVIGGDTIDLYPESAHCKVSIARSDNVWDGCANTKWIERTWKLKDACGRSAECIDTIVVIDSIPPEVQFDSLKLSLEEHPEFMGTFLTDTIGTDSHNCVGHGNLPYASVDDWCSEKSEVTVTVSSPTAGFGFLSYTGDQVINLAVWDVPKTKHLIIYKTSDACHNVREDTVVIVVKDLSPAVAVCHDAVNLTLTNTNSFTLMKAGSMDAESYDNCYTYQILARRTDWKTACGYDGTSDTEINRFYKQFQDWFLNDGGLCAEVFDLGFADHVPFCCEDVGEEIMVEVMVIDQHCNVDICWGVVNVENKIAPTVIERLVDDTITCTAYQQRFRADVEAENLAKLNDHFGAFVFDPANQTQWELKDIDCDGNDDFRLHWDGLLAASCTDNLIQCVTPPHLGCGKGAIKREWKTVVSGHEGSDTIVVATQKIFIKQCPMAGMIVPPDSLVEVEACDVTFDPNGSGNAAIDTDGPDVSALIDDCRELGIGFYDKVFDIVAGKGCKKVIRTWCVVDWCDTMVYDAASWAHLATLPGVWTFKQKILLTDNDPPRMDRLSINENNRTVNCSASLEATVRVRDACGATTRWSIINLGGDLISQGTGTRAMTGNLLPGEYILRFVATDACGNEASQMSSFNVSSEALPSVVAYTMLTAELMPTDTDNDNVVDDGQVTVWAEEFNSSSAPPCGGDMDNIVFCLRIDDGAMFPSAPNSDQNSVTFSCADRVGDGTVLMQFWVKDTVSQTADFTYVFVQLQDNMNACGSATAPSSLAGLIKTEAQEQVANVVIRADMPQGMRTTTSDQEGAFRILFSSREEVKVTPEKDYDHANGLSTLDLVKIQKHILGRQPIVSPYKLIAADANRDGKINPIDIIQLRRLIIGKDEELANNTSWRFVDAQHQFGLAEDAQAQDFPEYVMVEESTAEVNFIAIKVGDLDDNVVTSRSSDMRRLITANRWLESGRRYQVDLTLDAEELDGFQYALTVNQALDDLQVETALSPEHYHLSEHLLKVSWNGSSGLDQTPVSLSFTARADMYLADALALANAEMVSEAISADGLVQRIGLEFESASDDLQLGQNYPNPFKAFTTIPYRLESAGSIVLEIFDHTGRRAWVYTDQRPAGNGIITVPGERLHPGVYTYKLKTDAGTDSQRMVRLE